MILFYDVFYIYRYDYFWFKKTFVKMLESVEINFPTNHKFISMGIASYNMMSGINKKFEWTFPPKKCKINTQNFFRTILSGIHRQGDAVFNTVIPATFSCFQDNCFLAAGSFGIVNQGRHVYYMFGIFLELDAVSKNLDLIPIILKKAVEGAKKVKDVLTKGQLLFESTRYLTSIAHEINRLMTVGVEKPKDFFPFSTEKYSTIFLSQCLQGHLVNEMRTVIEAPTQEEANFMFDFLSHFLLDFQLGFSSNILQNEPNPDLCLQCVKSMGSIPLIKMLNFEKSYTWIRLSQKQVFTSPPSDVQNKYFRAFNIYSLDETSETGKKLKKYIETYNVVLQKQMTFSIDIVEYLLSVNVKARSIVCQHVMENIVMKSIILIDYINAITEKTQVSYIQHTQLEHIMKTLDIEKPGHLNVVVAVANIFNKTIYNKVFNGKREVLTQMIASI